MYIIKIKKKKKKKNIFYTNILQEFQKNQNKTKNKSKTKELFSKRTQTKENQVPKKKKKLTCFGGCWKACFSKLQAPP
jgi:hypothetical protein